MTDERFIPLVDAVAGVGFSYHLIWGAIVRGEIPGQRGDSGRLFVRVSDVKQFAENRRRRKTVHVDPAPQESARSASKVRERILNSLQSGIEITAVSLAANLNMSVNAARGHLNVLHAKGELEKSVSRQPGVKDRFRLRQNGKQP